MSLDEPTSEERYELNRLVSEAELTEHIAAFAKITGLAAGVVRHPKPNECMPKDRAVFDEWRLTPVVYYDRASDQLVTGGTAFCRTLRELEAADAACMWSDLRFAKQAFDDKRSVAYDCVPAGLRDHVAAIAVGGHHLANVYLGQLCRHPMVVDDAWKQFQQYVINSGDQTRVKDLTYDQFKTLFMSVPMGDDVAPEETITQALDSLAMLIASRASREGALEVVREISAIISPALSLEEGLTVFLQKISRVLCYSSGGVFLVNENGLLAPAACFYPGRLRDRLEFDLTDDRGAALHVFKTGERLRFDTRKDMDEKIPAAVPGSRDERGFQSFMACPLVTADGLRIGVLEIGSEKKYAFSKDDVNLLWCLSRFAAMFVTAVRKEYLLQAVTGERDFDTLCHMVVWGIQRCLRGTGCSIFLREDSALGLTRIRLGDRKISSVSFHEQPVYLVATTEFLTSAVGSLFYDPGEGLTGWVAKYKRTLNVPGGPGARTTGCLAQCVPKGMPVPRWEGKGLDLEGAKPRSFYEELAFLAVPIVSRAGTCHGVVRIGGSETNFTREDVQHLTACASAIASAIESIRSVQSLHEIQKAGVRIESLERTVNRSVAQFSEVPMRLLRLLMGFLAGTALLATVLTLIDRSWIAAGVLGGICLCAGTLAYRNQRRRKP